jgi:hypothetical protein
LGRRSSSRPGKNDERQNDLAQRAVRTHSDLL